MESHKSLPVHAFRDFGELLQWMETNHAASDGIWIKFARKDSGEASITYEEAREAAIIYGWIDGQKDRYAEPYYLTRFTPRRAKSAWSKINREIAEALIQSGRMHPAGLAQVEAARQDGRWEAAYESQSTMEVPAELQSRLDENPEAKAFFESISRANRYSFLYRIHTAKTEKTRQRHIEKAMEMLAAKQTYHPERK
jgi:uncharacterized protein YdeI (YjbR/CyaY-like superfamily)